MALQAHNGFNEPFVTTKQKGWRATMITSYGMDGTDDRSYRVIDTLSLTEFKQ